jgi:hypothetical protein
VTIEKMAVLMLFLLGSSAALAQTKREQPRPIQHEFAMQNFRTETGTVLPHARIVYGTYGHLNAAGDNAILLPSHYMADMNGYGWLIGPGKALRAAHPRRHQARATCRMADGRGVSQRGIHRRRWTYRSHCVTPRSLDLFEWNVISAHIAIIRTARPSRLLLCFICVSVGLYAVSSSLQHTPAMPLL